MCVCACVCACVCVCVCVCVYACLTLLGSAGAAAMDFGHDAQPQNEVAGHVDQAYQNTAASQRTGEIQGQKICEPILDVPAVYILVGAWTSLGFRV